MPQVVNGCGTWYYGRRNAVSYSGICSSCHRRVMLESYDTRLWVVIVFIPVIPLAAKRIIEECPSCRRHRVAPLSEYNAARQRAQDTAGRYFNTPHDATLAREAMVAAVGLRDHQEFMRIADAIESNLTADHEVLLMLAGGCALMGAMEREEKYLRAALAAKDCDETREALAERLIKEGKLEEAEPLLEHISSAGQPDKVQYLYTLAQGWQSKGRHDRAFELFDQCEAINPLIAKDEVFRKLRDVSQQALTSGKNLDAASVVRRYESGKKARRFVRNAAVFAVFAAVVYSCICYAVGRRRKIFLVSGLDRPYTVYVNDERILLTGHAVHGISVPEGDLRVRVDGGPDSLAAVVRVRAPFFSRPFDQRVYVVNPDRAAMLYGFDIVYVPRGSGSGGSGPTPTLHAGRLLHSFEAIDYAFEQPPTSVKVESHSEVVKHGLALDFAEGKVSPHLLVDNIAKQLGKESAENAATGFMFLQPDDVGSQVAFNEVVSAPRRADLLRPLLSRRPVVVEWHREYQDAMTELGRTDTALAEYEEFLRREPADRALMYLLARLIPERGRSMSLYQQAATEPGACEYGRRGAIHAQIDLGQSEKAIQLARPLATGQPGHMRTEEAVIEAFMAAGAWREAVNYIRRCPERPMPWNLGRAVYEIECLIASGQSSATREVISRTCPPLTGNKPNRMAAYLDAHVAACQGDDAAFVRLFPTDGHPSYEVLIAGGKLAEAEKVIADSKNRRDAACLLYLAALKARQPDLAQRSLSRAVESMRKDSLRHRKFAELFASHSSPDLDTLMPPGGSVEETTVYLTALGAAAPKIRAQCFAAAARTNYHTRFPHHLLKWFHDGGLDH